MRETLDFQPASNLPPPNVTVFVRGWGEGKKHYIWALADYVDETACRKWVDAYGSREILWFEPIEWAFLPSPQRE